MEAMECINMTSDCTSRKNSDASHQFGFEIINYKDVDITDLV